MKKRYIVGGAQNVVTLVLRNDAEQRRGHEPVVVVDEHARARTATARRSCPMPPWPSPCPPR